MDKSDLVTMLFVIVETLLVRIWSELESASIDFSSNDVLLSIRGDKFVADCEREIFRESSSDLSELVSVNKSPRLLVLLNTGEIDSDSEELGVSYESVKRFLLTVVSRSPLVERVVTLFVELALCLRLVGAFVPFGGIMAVIQKPCWRY